MSNSGELDASEEKKIEWILRPTFESTLLESTSFLSDKSSPVKKCLFIEIGPRLNFSTAFSTNAVSICAAVGLSEKINRIERSILYLINYEVISTTLLFPIT